MDRLQLGHMEGGVNGVQKPQSHRCQTDDSLAGEWTDELGSQFLDSTWRGSSPMDSHTFWPTS